MNTHELPMILFTVIAQLCVGTFIALGVMEVALSHRNDARTVRRITEPVLYAIGPALVLGLIVSMFHMNDVTHVLNVFRHWDSSWLSREILFGVGFSGLGFLFAVLQWFQLGSDLLRRLVGLLTAVVGIGLIVSMSMIYMSLKAIPAWHTPIVAFHFFMTTVILGTLAAGCALMLTVSIRRRNEVRGEAPTGETGSGTTLVRTRTSLKGAVLDRVRQINDPTTQTEWKLITQVMQWMVVVTAVAGIAVLISYPLHISALADGNQTAQLSAQVFAGGFFVARLALLGVATVLIGVFAYRVAGSALREKPQILVTLLSAAFVIALIAELMGRSLHYDSMLRIGM